VIYSIPWVRGAASRLQSLMLDRLHPGRFGTGLRVFGWPIITLTPGSTATFGRNLMLVSHSRFSEPGVSHPCVLRTLTPEAVITVGDNVGMSGCSVCAAKRVTIGDDCLVGADVLIADTDFHPLRAAGRRWSSEGIGIAPVEVGANVFIGARSTILKGVRIGDDAVVGAGSVVVDDVPAGAIVAGVPAREVGRVD
jgi:acetyltransferase-like isoleucine patch superfamily enzyme